MRKKKVKSSNIMAIGYDARKKLLEIDFAGGSSYQYSNVPSEVYHKFKRAVSFGKFFHSEIRDKYITKRKEVK